jgi:pimeloyl-ACP methyl ester carboxylesterase
MSDRLREHYCSSGRHGSFYLSCGPEAGPLVIFLHGWPELAISWRAQLLAFGALGFHAVAPDMRGYGRSTVHPEIEDYSLEEITRDMVELHHHLGAAPAVWVGHDLGSPVVWSMASHHPERCLAVASLCVPYFPQGFTPETLIPLVDRSVYPQDEYPAGQWDYQLFYQENFETATLTLQADPRATVKALMRSGRPGGAGRPYRSAMMRREGGWFGGAAAAPDVPVDTAVLTEESLCAYAAALGRNGFFGPDAWYMNAQRNAAFSARAPDRGRLAMPVHFIHAAYDWICATSGTRLADPLRASCGRLTESTVQGGHWLQQEKPVEVNRHLAAWLGRVGLLK